MTLIALILFALMTPAAFAATGEAPKRVFVLYDQNRDFAGLQLLDQMLTATLKVRFNGPLEIYTEFMDVARFRTGGGRDYDKTLREFYRQKYKGIKMDLLLGVFGSSLEFLVKHRSELFPGAPIVFCGIDRREMERLDIGQNTAGIMVKREFRPTLELALRLHPNTRRVYFVAGTSEFNRFWTEQARREFQESQLPQEITYLTELPMERLLAELKNLPPQSIVLYLHIFRDGAGQPFDPYRALALIAESANAPVYSFFDGYVGWGAVGGHVFSTEEHGKKAAELGLRILNGEIAAKIPVTEIGTNVNMFDSRVLQRWGIDETRLPPGSVLRFRSPSLWAQYRWYIVAALSAGLAQFVLIVALLVHRTKRRRSERALEKQVQFEQVVSEISAKLINAPHSRVDAEVRDALKQLRGLLDFDRCHVFEFLPSSQVMKLTHHCEPGDKGNQDLTISSLPWLFGALQQGRTVALTDVARDLPEHANHERVFARQAGIKSLLVIPIRTPTELIHGVMFQTTQRYQSWPDDLVERIHLMGKILVWALSRMRSEQDLRMSEARVTLAMESAQVGYWEVDLKTGQFYWSESLISMVGAAPGDFASARDAFVALVHRDDQDAVRRAATEWIKKAGAGVVDLRIVRPDGKIRWIANRGQVVRDLAGVPTRMFGMAVDITQRKREANLRDGERRVLEMIATAAPIEDVLNGLARFIESQAEGMMCSILLLGEDGSHVHHAAAPSLPEPYTKAIDGAAIGPRAGSCGTAMYRAQAVITTDILDDPLWEDYRELASAHGLRSCWSAPVLSSRGKVLGSFAMYYHEPRAPSSEEMQLIMLASDIAGIGIERKQVDQALRASQSRLKLAMEAARIGYWESDLATGKTTWSESMESICGLSPGEFAGTAEAFYERVHPEDRDQLCEKVAECASTLAAMGAEYRIILPNGETRWIAGCGQTFSLTGRNGRADRILGMAVDITERKLAEEALREALEEVQRLKEKMEAENVYLREEVSEVHRFGEIIARSEAMMRALNHAQQVSPTDTTVLLLGETGTGKELLARAIHTRSRRSDRPLVKVNCAALPATLIESELFGHERGAFTGAGVKRIGRFELADRATIFLDEIGELPLDLQVKLLRVLQEGEFERLGSSKTMKVDVRVIAATNRDLRRAVQEGMFREDLYYRLAVYPIELPPLRERKEDIEPLALEFLRESSRRLGKTFSGIAVRASEMLRDYQWPGNVRELQNVIERAAVISRGGMLRLPETWVPGALYSRIPNASNGERRSSESSTLQSDFPENGSATCGRTLQEIERDHVLTVLQKTRWRIEGAEGAAAVLGMKSSTLRSRMKKLGIRR